LNTLPKLVGVKNLEVRHENDAAGPQYYYLRLPTAWTPKFQFLCLKDTRHLALSSGECLPSIENDDDVAARKLTARRARRFIIDDSVRD
jgi:hypothetical protein